MKFLSFINSKGQVTLPQEIRHRLGLSNGDQVEFVIEGEMTVIRPTRSPSRPLDKYKGALAEFSGGRAGLDGWVNELRDEEREPE